jgi:scyllo-inositol 2-dehydrogenase (NADP+)
MSALSDDIQVGLIGWGVAGRVFHAPVIEQVEGLRLSTIVHRSADAGASSYRAARVVRSVDDLLADDRIRLVVIATPNTSHAGLARACLESGRHVVVDKPFAVSSAEAAPLLDAARRRHLVLTVFHNRRWDGDFLTVQRLVDQETCGRLVLLESRFDRYRPTLRGVWRERAEPGSGSLFDLGTHLVDQAVTLFGLPEALTGDVRIERDEAVVDDAFDVTLHYPGLRVLLRSTMLASAPGPRFVLQGVAGSYVKYHLDPQEARLAGVEPWPGNFWDQEPRERWGTLTRAGVAGVASDPLPTEAGDYRRFYANVRDAIRGTAPLAVTAEQALDSIRLIELAIESSRERRTLPTSCPSPTPQSA